ncbi:MAG: galactosyldiacylglycerol synthase [Alphaproteobacteria bacterium]|nr:galactosyldiacylglycerol synthase [Alphaproteobacteria bacterium]
MASTNTTPAPNIELMYFDAGGGHRSAMNALTASLATTHPHWNVKATNVQELLKPVDPVHAVTGHTSEDVYNRAITHGITWGSKAFLHTLQMGIRLNGKRISEQLQQHWDRQLPDMVVSMIPNFNRYMHRGLREVSAHTPYVTIMTDIADLQRDFWQVRHRGRDMHIICGSERAYRQAHLRGFYRPENIHKVSGMILKPAFYEAAGNNPPITLESLGLDPAKPTAIIMFGGNGSRVSVDIMDDLDAAGVDIQYIVLCGKDKDLQKSLHNRPRCAAIGFTNRVQDYMRISSVFIGKPGPGSLSEALHMGLPAIVENNGRTMVQERYNVTWVEEREAGFAVRKFGEIAGAMGYITRPDVLAHYRDKAAAFNNRAVFEIPAVLERILINGQATGPASPRVG